MPKHSSRSTDRRNSRYVQGGSTDQFPDRLGFWVRRAFPQDNTDEFFTLTPRYDRRPWLLAFDKYHEVELMWFILQYNTILDINTEFVTGKVILLPTATRVRIDLLSRSVI